MAISVCMATYNGEKFVREQMISILNQLSSGDEVIVVDDCSTDNTVNVIKELADSRIKIYLNAQNKSHVYTFGHAISLANNDIVFMSDQDDIWTPGRVKLMIKKLNETGLSFASSNFGCININGKEIPCLIPPLYETDSRRHFNNIIGILKGNRHYYGCTMAFRKDFIKLILPIPRFIESHDLWIALAGNLICSNIHIEEKTLMRRIHENNATELNRGTTAKFWTRVLFSLSIIILLSRHYLNKYINSKN